MPRTARSPSKPVPPSKSGPRPNPIPVQIRSPSKPVGEAATRLLGSAQRSAQGSAQGLSARSQRLKQELKGCLETIRAA
jgi:hypothetical protein